MRHMQAGDQQLREDVAALDFYLYQRETVRNNLRKVSDAICRDMMARAFPN